jgi:hypothetical protein
MNRIKSHFLISHANINAVSDLSDAEFGQLMRAVAQYDEDGTILPLPPMLHACFKFFKADMV